MKKFILPLGLALVFLVVFIGGIVVAESVAKNRDEITEEIILQEKLAEEKAEAARKKAEFEALIKSYFPEYDAYIELTDQEHIEIDDENLVTNTYEVTKEEDTLGYLYFVTVKGRQPNLNMMVAVDLNERIVLGYTVVSNNETPDFYAKVDEVFTSQFVNANMNLPDFEFETVTGATQSSTGIILAINLARQQFFQDLGEELPKASLEYTFVKFYQSLDNLDQYVYTFNDGEKEIDVVLQATTPAVRYFEYVSSSVELSDAEQAEAIRVAQILRNRPTTIILSVEVDENTKYSVRTNGSQDIIIATITFDQNSKVIDFVLTQEAESYPDKTAEMIERILNAGVNIQDVPIVTKATETSNALKVMVTTIIKTVEANK